MEEYVREAPQSGSVLKRLEYQEREESPHKSEEPEDEQKEEEEEEKLEEPVEEPEPEPEPQPEPPPLISTDDDDLLGLRDINPKAAELEESNAYALAIIPPGSENRYSASNALTEFSSTSGWELALVTTPSNINNTPPPETKLAGGFDNFLLNSLYEDENARRQLQMQNAGYGPYGMGAGAMQVHNPYEQQQQDPFFMSNNFAPPTNVQMAMSQQQQQQMMMQHHHHQQLPPSQSMMMVPYQNASPTQYPQSLQQQPMGMGSSNPFGDPFSVFPQNTTPVHGNHGLL